MSGDGIPSLLRLEVVNFETGESKVAHSNPPEVEELVSVIWSKKQPLGMSAGRLHYKGTDNRDYSFTLYFDADKVEGRASGAESIMDWRRFLLSLAHPVKRDDGMLDEPPDVLLIWPGWLTLRVKIDQIQFRYTRWVAGTEINIFTARLRLLAVGDVLVTSQDARTEGPERIEFIFG